MNYVAFGLMLICCHVWARAESNNMCSTVLKKINSTLQEGNNALDLLDMNGFKLSNIGNILNISVTNVNVTGLSIYNVNKCRIQLLPPTLILNFTWPLITANATYEIEVKDPVIYSNGYIKIFAKDLNVTVELYFISKGLYVQVKKVNTHFSMQKLDFRATGLDKETSELLRAVISDMPQLIKDYQNEITKKVNAIMTDTLNEFLNDKRISDLIKMLS